MEVSAFQGVAIDRIAYLTALRRFGTGDPDAVAFYADRLGDIAIVFADDTETIVLCFPYLQGVESEWRRRYVELDNHILVLDRGGDGYQTTDALTAS